jgi:formiminotetrahydrofolate cyclodeaminase
VLTELSLAALLEELAAPRPAPGAGSALAAALAAAAAVGQKAARLSSGSWPDAGGVAAQAEALRERALRLVDEDAEAYRHALEAQENPPADPSAERRDYALGRALADAAEPPLQLARIAADVAELCAVVAARGEPRVQADAAAASAIAAGVARGARGLVAVNLTATAGDPRVAEADGLAAAAETAATGAGRTS